MFSAGRPQQRRAAADKEWTKEELDREAETQLSHRLRGSRRSLKQRNAAADAAHLDRAPLFSAVIQWPGVMERLSEVFLRTSKSGEKRRGGLDNDDVDDVDHESRSPSQDSLVGTEVPPVEPHRPGGLLVVDNFSFGARSRSPAGKDDPPSPTFVGSQKRSRGGSAGKKNTIPKGMVGEDIFISTLWNIVLMKLIESRGTQGGGSPIEDVLDGDNMDEASTSPNSPTSTVHTSPNRRRGPTNFVAPPRLSIALQQVMTPDFERQHRTQFRRVFRLCDPQRLGGITWDTLTSYLLDSTMFMKMQRETSLALPQWYQIKDHVHTSSHRPRQLKQVGNTSAMLILDGSGQLFHFCSDTLTTKVVDMKKPGSPDPQILLIIDAEYIPPDNGICFSTVGADLYFFDMSNKNLEKVMLVDSAQILVWHAPGRRLVTGDREGRITFWTLHRTNAIKRTKAPLQLSNHFVQKGVAIQAIVCGQERDVVVAACVNGVIQVFCTVTSSSATSAQYAGGFPLRTFRTTSNILNCMCISEHQNVICCGTVLFHPELWSIDHGGGNTPFTLEARIVPHASPIVSVCCVRGNPQCISLDYVGVVKVWHMQLLTCLQTFILHKQDPRSPWRGLLEMNGYLFCTDRISIGAFHVVEDGAPIVEKGKSGAAGGVGKSIEFAVAQRGATLGAVYVAEHGPSLVSLSGPTIAYWDLKTQRITAQLDPTAQNLTITCACMDMLGHRCFIGDKGGSVWVINVSTAGVLEGFPRAHDNSPVRSIGFLRHAGIGISCSDNGIGVLLAPSSQQQAAASQGASSRLQQRVQQLFHSMDTGLLTVVDEPWYMIITADRRHRVHVFSSADVGVSAKLHEIGSVFIPDILASATTRASSFRKKSVAATLSGEDTEFLPKGRCIVDIQHVPNKRQFMFVVADNTSLSIIGLQDALQRDPPYRAAADTSPISLVLIAQWNIFSSFDGSISCILYSALPESERSSALERVGTDLAKDDEDEEAAEERSIQQQLVMQGEEGGGRKDRQSEDGGSDAGAGSTTSPSGHETSEGAEGNGVEGSSATGVTDFERDMEQLYASQRAREQLVLDPQIILLRTMKAAQERNAQASASMNIAATSASSISPHHATIRMESSFDSESSIAFHDDHQLYDDDSNEIAAHLIVVAMESGSIVIFDISTALRASLRSLLGIHRDAFKEACLFPLRMTKLNSPVTCFTTIDSTSICAGRADGLMDVLEVPSLGLMWSGLTSVADAPDYFPPTVDAQQFDGTLAKLQNTVTSAFGGRGGALTKLRSGAGSSMALGRTKSIMVASPNRKASTMGGNAASPKGQGFNHCFGEASSPKMGRGTTHFSSLRGGTAGVSDTPLLDEATMEGSGGDHNSSTSTTPPTTSRSDGTAGRYRPLRQHSVKHHQSMEDMHPSHPLPLEESVWILGQLSTLVGDRSFLKHIGSKDAAVDVSNTSSPQGKRGERLLRTTPSGVLVFQGKDPFAECTPVTVDGETTNGGGGAAAVVNQTDHRKSQREKNQEQFSVQNPVRLKTYGDLGVDRPSSSRSFTRDVTEEARCRLVPDPIPRASVLRPLSSTSMTSHLAVSSIPSRAATPGILDRRRSGQSIARPSSVQAMARPSSTSFADVPARLQLSTMSGARLSKTSANTNRRMQAVELPPWLPRL
ncbi:Hypothetical protein, putative [Bodo saltans]|uniref:WD40 repeat-containing protein n=1 Tax=Bodo saltans TaxID=75058 RepID=A0A0S4ILE4_BODSA|nr:Hypothetical protein, putative [Bodo saltans]|eukprot:CUE71287.1 Hypothetical protein, putative [Bodo saltans]